MRVLVQIGHPGHVHFYKHYVRELESAGHDVVLIVQEKDITRHLLDALGFEYVVTSKNSGRRPIHPLRVVEQSLDEYATYDLVRSFQPDLMTGMAAISVSHVSALTGIPSLIFVNNEHATLENRLVRPFATRICTHEYFWTDLGANHVRYPGYHELAYLHPNRFEPDPSVLDEAGLAPDETFVVVRLVSWRAAHDVGHSGLTDPRSAVRTLENAGATVLITSEADVPPELSSYVIDVPPRRIHHLLYYADLFLGESATMACESAVLGTPAIYVASIYLGYLDELESRYGLVFCRTGPNKQQNGLEMARRLLNEDAPERYRDRRNALLDDKRDTTEYMLEQTLELVDR